MSDLFAQNHRVYTTIKRIRDDSPCEDGYKKLCKNLGGIKAYGEDTPITFQQIYESNGYADTLWCLSSVDKKWSPLLRHFACDMAESVSGLVRNIISDELYEMIRQYADEKIEHDKLMNKYDYNLHATSNLSSLAAIQASGYCDNGGVAAGRAAAAVIEIGRFHGKRKAVENILMNYLFSYCKDGTRQYGFNLNNILIINGDTK